MTEDERCERIEATASRMIAELLERAANGEALPVQGAFVLRIRAPWPKRLATRTPSPSRRATWPCSRTWPRRWSWRAPRPPSTVPRPPAPAAPPSGPPRHNLRTRTWVAARNHRRITAPHTRTFNHGAALGVCAAGDLRHATGRQPHDPSPVSGRLRRSAGRDRFSVVGEQMANFGRCWHAGHGR